MDHGASGTPASHSHQHGIQREVSAQARPRSPANDQPGEQVHHDREIEPTLLSTFTLCDGGMRFLVTLDDGLAARSITDRDHAAGLFALDLYIVFGSHDHEVEVRSRRSLHEPRRYTIEVILTFCRR